MACVALDVALDNGVVALLVKNLRHIGFPGLLLKQCGEGAQMIAGSLKKMFINPLDVGVIARGKSAL